MKNTWRRHCWILWKQILARKKYRHITAGLCEYVNELVVGRAVDKMNKIWYNERLAAAAHLLALLLARDGIRFLGNLFAENEEILRSRVEGAFAKASVAQWKTFAVFATKWRAKYYSNGKTFTRGYL